jgi:hypothetical protein
MPDIEDISEAETSTVTVIAPETEVTPDSVVTSDTVAMTFSDALVVAERKDLSVDEIADVILAQKGILKKQVVSTFLVIGVLLNAAKHKLAHHGMWVDWLRTNIGMSVAYAQQHMKMAREYQANTYPVTHLGVKKAYALLALPADEREAFANESSDMSTKEFTAAIKERVGGNKRKRVSRKRSEEAFPLVSHDEIKASESVIDFDSNFEFLHSCVDGLIGYIDGLEEDSDERDDLTAKLRDLVNGIFERIPMIRDF